MRKYIDLGLVIDYSKDPEKLARLHGVIENNSNQRMLNYTYYLLATHPATVLDLESNGGIYYKPRWFHCGYFVNYTRKLVPPHPGEVSTRIDMDRKEIEFKVNSNYLWGLSSIFLFPSWEFQYTEFSLIENSHYVLSIYTLVSPFTF